MFTMLAIAAAFALVTAGYFPLSFFAYQCFRAEAIRDRLKLDFQLLGLFSAQTQTDQESEFKNLYRKASRPAQFLIYVTLTTVLTLLGFAVFYFRASITFMPSETLEPMFYGFLGAYIFSVQLIYRRYSTLDLQPQVYQYVVLRMVTVLAIIYTGVTALGASAADTEGLLPILAFIIGYFPDTGLRWFAALANQVFSQFQQRPREHPLSMIEGISMWHEARLKESGIDNAQNLATADIKELLLSTRFSGQQLIDWIDQAILYVYAGDNNIGKFREHNICTISDFRSIWKDANTRGDVAQMLGLTKVDLDFLYQATEEGPSLYHATNYWGNLARYLGARVEVELRIKRESLERMPQLWARARDATITGVAETSPEQEDVLQPLRELIDRINEATPEELVPEPPDTAAYHVGMGNLRHNAGDYPGAIEAYTKAIKLNDAYTRAYRNRANSYTRLKDYPRAITDNIKAIELDPENVMAYYNMACVYSLSGDSDQALSWLRQAFEKDRTQGSIKHVTLAHTDSDFDPIRDDREFQALLAEFAPGNER